MTHVFVAPKIRVGFQKREDTFTGQLAYIIYYDEKGKIRKEKSWETWRDKKIASQEFDNTPLEGFTLNKDIKRYSGEWFSSNRTLIRVHDPRGFEFEVTTENLIAILMHTDCLRRGLIGQFVYAWVGPELVLLPTNSEEYQTAVKYTSGLAKKVKAKELTPGISYKTKREGDVIFMGKLKWHEYDETGKYGVRIGLRQEKNVFVFTNDDGKTFCYKNSVAFLSEPNSATPVSNFAELMDKFNKKIYAHKIVKYEFRPTTFDGADRPVRYYKDGRRELKRNSYFTEYSKGVFTDCNISMDYKYVYENTTVRYDFKGYVISDRSYYNTRAIRQENGEILTLPQGSLTLPYGSPTSIPTTKDLALMQQQKFLDLHVTLDNGKERKVESFNDLFQSDYDDDNDEL